MCFNYEIHRLFVRQVSDQSTASARKPNRTVQSQVVKETQVKIVKVKGITVHAITISCSHTWFPQINVVMIDFAQALLNICSRDEGQTLVKALWALRTGDKAVLCPQSIVYFPLSLRYS